MSFARELAEAVEAPSIPEQVGLLELLDERVTTAVHSGFFTEEAMEAAFVVLLEQSGVLDEDEVFETIGEFLDEELAELGEGLGDMVKKALGKAAKEVAKGAADAAAKRLTKVQTKTKTGKMLKHAAAGAIKQIGKDPKKTKEILKKSAKKAGKKLLRKGMKMVFGKWVKMEERDVALGLVEATAVGVTSYDVPTPGAVVLKGSAEPEQRLAFSNVLAKKLQKLKKDVPGVAKVRQGYRGTGKQNHRRQIWVDFKDSSRDIDVWLSGEGVAVGGVRFVNQGRIRTIERTVDEVYADIVKALKMHATAPKES